MTGLGGETLATAKWVGIQYGMKDQPNRLLYGGETYAVDGAFELADVSELEQAIADYYE
jgi:hypothetical protein